MHIQKLKDLFRGATMVGLMLLVGLLVLVAAPTSAFAAENGKIKDAFPPGNNGAAVDRTPVTVVLIEVESEKAPYVFVTDEPFDLEEGTAVIFTEGPGRTATDVQVDGNAVVL